MAKLSLNFIDPFGSSPLSLHVDGKIAIKELAHLLAEELGYIPSDDRVVGGLFKNDPLLPVIYDPKVGVLANELPLNQYKTIKSDATFSYYVFPPTQLSVNDIFMMNASCLGAVSLVVTVEWAGRHFPIILPAQTSRDDVPLIQFVFAQIKTILGIQAMPQGWQGVRWQLHNGRTEERIDGAMGGNIAEKIRHGDLLRLSPKTRNEHDEIVILDEKTAQDSEELDIKIGDDLLDNIVIEQAEPITINNCQISLAQGDITLQEVDAIVNAAKPTLNGGGGVDGAIHQAAGPSLVKASEILAPCPPGKAVLTPGFSLPAKWVIHTVGPMYKDGNQDEEKTLTSAYRSSLAIAFYSGFNSIVFPSISTGVYGYPVNQAAEIAWKAIADALKENKDGLLKVIRIVVFDQQTYDAYAAALNHL